MGSFGHNLLRFLIVSTLAVLLLAPASQAIAWSPKGRIVYAKSGDMWVCKADGSDKRRITSGPSSDLDPTWSGNHKVVYFVRDDKICRVGGKGGKVSLVPYADSLAREPGSLQDLAVFLDGRKLAFADFDFDAEDEISSTASSLWT